MGLLPPTAQPSLLADTKPTTHWLPYLQRGVLLESSVHAQLTLPWTRPPQLRISYCMFSMMTADTECLLSVKHQLQDECSKHFTCIDLFSQQTYVVSAMAMSILQIKKLRHRERKQMALSHSQE